MAYCQDLFKYWRYLMMVTVGYSQEIGPIALKNAEIVRETFKGKVSRECVKYFQEGVQEYVNRLPDKKSAWYAVTARLAHRIDYEFTHYGIRRTNWSQDL
jgi:elongation factor P hydroxylase